MQSSACHRRAEVQSQYKKVRILQLEYILPKRHFLQSNVVYIVVWSTKWISTRMIISTSIALRKAPRVQLRKSLARQMRSRWTTIRWRWAGSRCWQSCWYSVWQSIGFVGSSSCVTLTICNKPCVTHYVRIARRVSP